MPGTELDQQRDQRRRVWSPADAQLPLSSVRSLAFTAAIHEAALEAGDDHHREVRELIRAGLDPARNPSVEVRGAVAPGLSVIVRNDPEWAAELAVPMLAGPPEELADVAWAAVLDERPTNLDVVGLLRTGVYEHAVAHVAVQDHFSDRRREQLGKQLIGAAVFGLDGTDGALSASARSPLVLTGPSSPGMNASAPGGCCIRRTGSRWRTRCGSRRSWGCWTDRWSRSWIPRRCSVPPRRRTPSGWCASRCAS